MDITHKSYGGSYVLSEHRKTEKSEKYFGHKLIQIWSFQGVVVPKKMYFLTRNPMVISPGPGEAQISQLYRKNNKKMSL